MNRFRSIRGRASLTGGLLLVTAAACVHAGGIGVGQEVRYPDRFEVQKSSVAGPNGQTYSTVVVTPTSFKTRRTGVRMEPDASTTRIVTQDIVIPTPPPAEDLLRATAAGNIAGIQALLARGLTVESATTNGLTALMAAAVRGQLAGAKYLLMRGADPRRASATGQTALMFAAQGGHADVAAAILAAGAPVDRADARGWTALMYAANGGHVAAARFLLQHGASTAARDAEGRDALALARARPVPGLAELLAAPPAR